MFRGKKYLESLKLIEVEKNYSLEEAIALGKKTSKTKFDSALELSVRLNIEQKHSIRGVIAFEYPVQKTPVKILVFAEGDKVNEALEAGADYAGFEEYFEKVKSGWIDFDVVIATSSIMKELVKLGSILGKKGLMPNPKLGTVSDEIKKTVQEFKKGKSEYRADKTGVVHSKIGYVSMDDRSVKTNIVSLYQELLRKKPSDIKGDYVKSVYLSSTMGPSVKIDSHAII